jgi:hypothetical protein
MMMNGLKHVRDWRLLVGEVEADVKRMCYEVTQIYLWRTLGYLG